MRSFNTFENISKASSASSQVRYMLGESLHYERNVNFKNI